MSNSDKTSTGSEIQNLRAAHDGTRPKENGCSPPPTLKAVVEWWQREPERAKCTLREAIILYNQTFPGRSVFLLLELVEHFMDDNDT